MHIILTEELKWSRFCLIHDSKTKLDDNESRWIQWDLEQKLENYIMNLSLTVMVPMINLFSMRKKW